MKRSFFLHDDTEATSERLQRWLTDAHQDIWLTARQMRRALGLTMLIVVTLAVGIGANVTLAGAIRHLLLEPPEHIRHPDRVVRLLRQGADSRGASAVLFGGANYPRLLDMQQEATAFDAVAGLTSRYLSVGHGPDAFVVHARLVSADFFPLLGATPILGRVFSAMDGYSAGPSSSGGAPLAVLSYDFWQRRYDRDPAVLNRLLDINEIVYTIVGVMPAGFRDVSAKAPDLWLPLTVAAADPDVMINLSDRAHYPLALIARLRPFATHELASQQASAIWMRGARVMHPVDSSARTIAASIIRGRSPDAPREVKVALWLGAVSALVLLITCANVANLLLGRAIARRHEVAVRLAIGAGRGRLARQLMTEGVMLAAISGAAALGVAAAGGPLLNRLLLGDAAGSFIDTNLFLFATSVALGTGLAISLAPVLQSVRGNQINDLRAGGTSGGRRAWGTRMTLLTTQSALCMTMLIGAGLFALSLKRLAGLDLGIDAQHTIQATVNLDELPLPNDAIQAVYDQMLWQVRSVPGVVAASVASRDPYSAGRAVAPHTTSRGSDYFWPPEQIVFEAAVGNGFFGAVGASSLRGRDFERTDDRSAPAVAIVNAPFARTYFPNQDALGQCVILPVTVDDHSEICVTIVGVLSGVWYGTIFNRDKPMVYVPLAQKRGYDGTFRPQGIFVRVKGDPGLAVEPIRRALQSVRSDLPAVRVKVFQDVLEAEMRPWRLGTTMFTVFGAVALVVAVVGLYAVVAFAAQQRSYEIAVRQALGARRRDVLRTVSGDALGAVTLGLAIGTLIVLLVRRWVGPLLYETDASDPRVIVGVAALLFAVGFLAALVPTARVVRSNTAAILRSN